MNVGWLAVAAGLAFGLALIMLMAFFVTRVERFDRLAEWSFVVFALCAIPTIVAVPDRLSGSGPLTTIATAIGVASVATVGLGELGSALRLVDFRRVAPLMTIGFVGFLLWIGVVSVIAIAGDGLPAGLGWLGLAAIVLGIATVAWIVRLPGVMRGEREPPQWAMIVFFVPMIGIVTWMVWLGLSL